jgi:hypothetical protein
LNSALAPELKFVALALPVVVKADALTRPVARILVVPAVICTLPVELATDMTDVVWVVVLLPTVNDPVFASAIVGEVVVLPVHAILVEFTIRLAPE